MSEGGAAISCVGVPSVTSRFCAFCAYLLWMQLAWLWSFTRLWGNNICLCESRSSETRDTPRFRALMESSLESGAHFKYRSMPERTGGNHSGNGSDGSSLIFSQQRAQHQSLPAHFLTSRSFPRLFPLCSQVVQVCCQKSLTNETWIERKQDSTHCAARM